MTAFELMDTNQNEALKENKSHPSLKLSKFMSSTPALNTPPPESVDFYHEISLSDISLNRLEHIVEDTGFQEDTALTPLIHSPPQSATSVERKNFHRLNSDFISKHSLFKLNLQRSLSRFNRLRQSYLRERPRERSALAYELDRIGGSDNELTDDEVELDDESFWCSRRLRLGSEWTRCRQKLSLIECNQSKLSKSESAKLVNIKSQLKHLSSKNANAIEHFRTNVIKWKCVCDSMTSSQEMCVFCSLERLSKPNKGPKRTLENVYLDHSYTKLPKLDSSNAPVDDLDFLNCVDDDALNKMVNERLDKIFSPVDHFSKQCDPLPNLTTEELMEFFEEKFEPVFLDAENLSPLRPSKKPKTYNQAKLKEFRLRAKKAALSQRQQSSAKECAKIKRMVGSRSSSTSMMNEDAPYISSNTDKYNINNILIPSELISNQKISSMPAHKITTPGWRITELEPLCDGPKPDEELDDTSILDRHKIIEMKEKINFSNIKNSLDTPLKDSESNLPSNGSNRNLEWPVRNFPLSDQDYKAMVDER